MTELEQFESFMRDYQDMVFATAVRLLGHESDAQDVSQEVFLRAYQRFAEIHGSPTVGGWLKTVTRNLCLNHLSRYRSRWRLFSEFGSDSESDEHPYEIPSDETQHRDSSLADQRQLLEETLRKLPENQRVPLVLYHFEEMSYEEIAEHLRISLAKVKTNIFRAREVLRRRLKLDAEGDLAGSAGLDAVRLAQTTLQKA